MNKQRLLVALAAAALIAGLSAGTFAAEAKKGKTGGSGAATKPAPQKDAAKTDSAAKTEASKGAKASGPVAVVNGTPIPRADYDRSLKAYLQSVRQMPGAPDVAEDDPKLKEEVINQLVDRELLYQESRKFVTEDTKAEVDGELGNLKARFPSSEAFAEVLKAQALSEDELKALLAKQVSVRKYIDKEIAPGTKITEEDVKKLYEENKDKLAVPEQVEASHILIRVAPDAKPEEKEKAKAKAQDLQKKAAAGGDFAQLAKENSEDPGSAPNGGSLGYFVKEQMVEPFAVAAFALKPGQVSEVVETQFGFHVIKVTGHKDAGVRPLEEVKSDIENYLKARALNDALVKKVAELRKDAKIEIPKA